MRVGSDHSVKLQLRPAVLSSRPDIPHSLLDCQLGLQNDYVLCPTEGHGFSQHFRGILIGTEKLTHPAQVPGREARNVRVSAAQILRSSDSGAFLLSAADQPANLIVQIHLWQGRSHQRVQRCKHGAVVYRFSDVHSDFSFPARVRLFYLLVLKSPTSRPSTSMPRACSLAISGGCAAVTPSSTPPSAPTG